MINNHGRACLADFGLLTIISDETNITSTAVGATTAQWMSPELLFPDKFDSKGYPTKASDCYALGMVIYEVLSGQAPFSRYSSLSVAWRVLEGERPKRPRGAQSTWFTDDIWGILELCWKSRPADRLSAQNVLLGLEGNLTFSNPPFNVDEDAVTDVDDDSDAASDDSQYVLLVSPSIIIDLCMLGIGP